MPCKNFFHPILLPTDYAIHNKQLIYCTYIHSFVIFKSLYTPDKLCGTHYTHTTHTHHYNGFISLHSLLPWQNGAQAWGAGPCTMEMIRQWPAGSHRLVESIIYGVCVIMWSLVYDYVTPCVYNHVILCIWSCDPLCMIMWSLVYNYVIPCVWSCVPLCYSSNRSCVSTI